MSRITTIDKIKKDIAALIAERDTALTKVKKLEAEVKKLKKPAKSK